MLLVTGIEVTGVVIVLSVGLTATGAELIGVVTGATTVGTGAAVLAALTGLATVPETLATVVPTVLIAGTTAVPVEV